MTDQMMQILAACQLPFAERLRARRKLSLERCIRLRAMADDASHPNRDVARFALKKDQIILLKIRAERTTGFAPGGLQ